MISRSLPSWLRWSARLVLALAASVSFAHWWCGRGAGAILRGDLATQQAMAAGVNRWVEADLSTEGFATGSPVFDGEWLFGTYIMSGLGLVQTAWGHPELREQHAGWVRQAVAQLLTTQVRAFDTRQWHADAIDTLGTDEGDHAAYLGYLNLLLACQQLIDPKAPTAELHERISQTLERRLKASRIGLLQTYPGECYPVDNAAVLASLALRERTKQGALSAQVQGCLNGYDTRWKDPASGLVIQAVNWKSGRPIDQPRGSGTNLAAYFLSFADATLARKLHLASTTALAQSSFGFTALREYPAGHEGHGDIDSGPLVFGLSISSTGFSLAGCRQFDDPAGFTARWRLVHLIGTPAQYRGELHFIMGGRLGDAIHFAMCTAVPPAVLNHELSRLHP